MRQRIKTYRCGLVYTRRDDESWSLETADLPRLTRALGRDVLVAFLRCFVWVDRLQSLGSFGYFDKSPRNSLTHLRNINAIAWSASGAVFEAADAVRQLEAAGLPKLLADPTAWRRLKGMANRWSRTKSLVRLRHNIAFHVDPKVMRKGLERACRADERLTLIGGDTRKAGTCSMRSGTDLLLHGLDLSRQDFERMASTLRHDHLTFAGLVQSVFRQALRGAGAMD